MFLNVFCWLYETQINQHFKQLFPDLFGVSKRALGAHAAFLFLVKDLVHKKFCKQSHFRIPSVSQSVFKGRAGWAPDTKLCLVKLFFDLRGEFAIQPESHTR